MKSKLLLASLAALVAASTSLRAADAPWAAATPAANAVNAFGIDLLRQSGRANENALISPYSIETALLLAYAGANGDTRAEMAQALRLPKSPETSFGSLRHWLDEVRRHPEATGEGATPAPEAKPKEPIVLLSANRIYVQGGFALNPPYVAGLKENYDVTTGEADFAKDPAAAAQAINDWVSQQTNQRIPGLLPDGALDTTTRVVLVNAVYLKAPWNKGFRAGLTKPAAFRVNGGAAADVPMMQGYDVKLGLARRPGFTAVAIPYTGSQLQFLILLPDKPDGLAALEAKLTPEMLASCARLEISMMDLSMPRFKSEPATMNLNKPLRALGMKLAFGPGADFSRISPKSLQIAGVFHKCYLSVDENGTEAAAATAVAAAAADGDAPDDIHVDRPFLFAVQDRQTGACLFLGRVNDPR
jgi:serpin B